MTLQLGPLHIWLLTIVNLLVILGVLALLAAHAPIKNAPEQVPVPSAEAIADIDEDALNAFGKAIIRAGLPHCVLPMNQLAERVLVGHKVGVYRFPVNQKGFASMSMEVTAKNGAVIYMSFNLSEIGATACAIGYEAVTHWQNTCEDVLKGVFKDFTPTRRLGERIAILTHDKSETRKVFTMPVQGGCVVTEKEVVHFARG